MCLYKYVKEIPLQPRISIIMLTFKQLMLCSVDKLMGENTINNALRKMGYDTKAEVCDHGFHFMACSALVESGLW